MNMQILMVNGDVNVKVYEKCAYQHEQYYTKKDNTKEFHTLSNL